MSCGNDRPSQRTASRRLQSAKRKFVAAQRRNDRLVATIAAAQVFEDLLSHATRFGTGTWDIQDAVLVVKDQIKAKIVAKNDSRKRV